MANENKSVSGERCMECGNLVEGHARCESLICEDLAETVLSNGLAYCRTCADYLIGHDGLTEQ